MASKAAGADDPPGSWESAEASACTDEALIDSAKNKNLDSCVRVLTFMVNYLMFYSKKKPCNPLRFENNPAV